MIVKRLLSHTSAPGSGYARTAARVAPFLGGQSYSIADIATVPWAGGVGTFLGKPAEADYPKLMAWVATINSRPAVTRALAAVDEARAKTTVFDKAGEGAKDRVFGRGRYAA